MAKKKENFGQILIRRGILSPEQVQEADQMAREQGKKINDVVVQLGYATGEEVMRAVAEEHGHAYVDLHEVDIPEHIIELVPESVARENVILPMDEEEETLRVIVSDPLDLETFDKLRFILNRKVEIALAPKENIVEAINRYYGQVEGESADSMLQEFTDTAIDFTETEEEVTKNDEVVDENSAPIVRIVQLMINEAVQL
jgi:type IV pilus assembly protein PilB